MSSFQRYYQKRPFLLVLMLVAISLNFFSSPRIARVTELLLPTPANIPIVESAHPYQNDEIEDWIVNNTTGSDGLYLIFSRIELEEGVDRIELRDEDDTLIQVITTNAPNGLVSNIIPGSLAKITLVTDKTDRYWGFAVSEIDAATAATKAYSPHPYPNNYDHIEFLLNETANPAGTRVVFSDINLEEHADYIIISDAGGTPYQWITGNHSGEFVSKAVPGAAVRVQLVSDGSVNAWGYNVKEVQTAVPDAPDDPPDFSNIDIQSPHNYPNSGQWEWIAVNPDPYAVTSKLHFKRIGLNSGDTIRIYDEEGTLIQYIGHRTSLEDFWTDVIPGRIAKIVLSSGDFYTGWGFHVDAILAANPYETLAESDHNYSSSDQWVVTNPDTAAEFSKVHFEKLRLRSGDSLSIKDDLGNLIQYFGQHTYLEDFWSDYVPGRRITLHLQTSDVYHEWGFRVDKVVTSLEKPVLAQSEHPYSKGGEWIVINENINAESTRIHFSRIQINSGDTLEVLDQSGNVIQSFGRYTNLTNVWSEPVPGHVVYLKMETSDFYNDWGFRVDDVSPKSNAPIPEAYIDGVYIRTLYPGEIYLHGTLVAKADQPGEYKIPLPGNGEYLILVDYPEFTQHIRITFNANNEINIAYLPLIRK